MDEYWNVTVSYNDGSQDSFRRFLDIRHYDTYMKGTAFNEKRVIIIPYKNVNSIKILKVTNG